MLRKNRYAFATKFDLCAFGCFAPSVEKIRIKFDLCVFGRGIGFCAKTAFVIKYKIHPTYKICFDRYSGLGGGGLLICSYRNGTFDL